MILGLVGRNIGASLSPAIHHYSAACLGLKAVEYRLFSLAQREQLEKFIHEFWLQGGWGLNITSPYKSPVARLLDVESEAVNVLFRGADAWQGASSDGEGFARGLSYLGRPLSSYRDIVVLGFGGAVVSLLEYFIAHPWENLASLRILCRPGSPQREAWVRRFAPRLPLFLHDFNPARLSLALAEADADTLLIQGSSAPLEGDPLASFVPALRDFKGTLSDLVYGYPSALLSAAEKQGILSQDGLPMLVEQARLAQELWWGQSLAGVDILRYLRTRGGGKR